jgi:preprotein translocase subunit SecD
MILLNTRSGRAALLAVALVSCGVAAGRAAQGPRPRGRRGVSLLLAVKADGPRAGSAVGRTAAVLRKRCAGLRIRCELRPRPGGRANRLLIRFSPAAGAARVKRVLLAQGLELRAVVSPPSPSPLREYATRAEAAAAAGGDQDVLPLEDSDAETYLVAERAAIITGDDARGCAAVRADPHGFFSGYEVDCRLTPAGAARLKAWTGANINRYIAVVFNGRAVSAPYIKAPIWLNFAVSVGRDRRRAEEVAVILSSGNLPAPVELLEESAHKP